MRVYTRSFDIFVSLAALVVLAPLIAGLALAVKVTSRGPVLYGSTRLAYDKPTFRAWKFRSMYQDADERLSRLLAEEPAFASEYAKFRKLKNDPRVTPVGRFIRRSSLDELPQLVNILAGEMSVVGPRPKLINELDQYGDQLNTVLSVKPGLTGLWQVSGRNLLTLAERVQLDIDYVQGRSPIADARICAITLKQIWRPTKHGAY